MWLVFAFGSALFAGVTSILAKCGIRQTDSTVATAIRTVVVLAFSWLMVFVVGSQDQLRALDARTLVFLILSGLATGASWLCYFKALQLGDVNKVVPVDNQHSAHDFACGRAIGRGQYRCKGRRHGADRRGHDSDDRKEAGNGAKRPRRALAALRAGLGGVCQLDRDFGQNRHRRRGIQSRHGHPHLRGARDVVGDGCFVSGKTAEVAASAAGKWGSFASPAWPRARAGYAITAPCGMGWPAWWCRWIN